MAYDKIENLYDDTWVNRVYKKLYTVKMKYRRYCTFLKRYNGSSYDYFICLSDKEDKDHKWINVQHYKTGFKISLCEFSKFPIWSRVKFINNVAKFYYEIDDKFDDGEIYRIL